MADSPINADQTDLLSQAKMKASEIVGDVSTGIDNAVKSVSNFFTFERTPPGVPKGAVPVKQQAAAPTITSSKGVKVTKKDLRVKINVPSSYISSTLTAGPDGELAELNGIIFPYTPSIAYEHKADYATSNPMHSNFALNFYQRSSVSPITITGKFTVQNDTDAKIYLATVHLLRSLTKMRYGTDLDRGSPPPICRLHAYGDFMLSNVPVAISSFRLELPDSVDYYTAGVGFNSAYGQASVPVISTIAITCIPMYSRAEMQKFSVTGWLGNANVRKSGIL